MKVEIDVPDWYEVGEVWNPYPSRVIVDLKPKKKELWERLKEGTHPFQGDFRDNVCMVQEEVAKQWMVKRMEPIFKHYGEKDKVIFEDIKKAIGYKGSEG